MSPAAYRPISLLPVVSKLVEKQVQVQLLRYMEGTSQFNKSHNAYRTAHGTTTAMLELADEVFDAADRKEIADLMTIDQTAAFDCVQHQILEEKSLNFTNSQNTQGNGSRAT